MTLDDNSFQLIESLQNPLVKATAALAQKKERLESGLILVETKHPIEEALKANLKPKYYFYLPETTAAMWVKWPDPESVYPVTAAVMKKMVTTDSVAPCLAVFEAPDLSWESFEKKQSADKVQNQNSSAPLYLLLDRLQDPGNLGTVIRSALAFCVDAVILVGQSVEAMSPKVIRASAGLVFPCPIIQTSEFLQEVLARPELRDTQKLFTTGHSLWQGQVVESYRETDYKKPTVIIFGNEGQGLSEEILAGADGSTFKTLNQNAKAIRIPLEAAVESLNISVSASVILAEAAYQRKQI